LAQRLLQLGVALGVRHAASTASCD
jgi:hypothetical protein